MATTGTNKGVGARSHETANGPAAPSTSALIH